MSEFNKLQINRLILRKHHLATNSKIDDVLQISNDLCGLHGTGTIEPYLSLFARMINFKKEDLDKELFLNKNLGRIRGMRKTLFIETKKMIPIVHNAISHKTGQRDNKYLEYREISNAEYETISNQILTLLNKNELSTSEIKKQLNTKKDIIAVISVMCDEMLLIRGKPLKSWRDRRICYAPFASYFPDIDLEKFSESKATVLLIDKYIKTYGPITADDIVWWLGITKSKVKTALNTLKSKLESIKIQGLEYNYIINKVDLKSIKQQEENTSSIISILPNLDPYMMGYKNRERYIDNSYYEYIFDRSGNATTIILIDGFVVGIWDIIEKPRPQMKIFLFNEVEDQIKSQIELECKKVGKFITEKDVSIKLCRTMIPLTKRTMGGFMSPLKEC